MLTVLLAEDHELVRSGLRMLLDAAGDIAVVGEACDGDAAVRLAAELAPAVVIMDVGLPGRSGIEATEAIRRAQPSVRVLMLSASAPRQHLVAAFQAGACGYLLKDAPVSELLRAVREVAAGRRYVAAALSELLLDYLSQPAERAGHPALGRLTQREVEVLRLLGQSLGTEAIARALHISPHTVVTHRRNLMEKLDLHDRVALVKFAIRVGLGTLD